MIKHELKDNLLYVSIANMDFSYRIPVKKLGKTMSWKIGEKELGNIVIEGVSAWTVQLFSKSTATDNYIKQFKGLIHEHCPENEINWEDTLMAIKIQHEYDLLSKTKNAGKNDNTQNEILSFLADKYKLA